MRWAAAEAVRAHAALTIVSVVAPFTAPIGQNVEGWVEAEQYVEARRDLARRSGRRRSRPGCGTGTGRVDRR